MWTRDVPTYELVYIIFERPTQSGVLTYVASTCHPGVLYYGLSKYWHCLMSVFYMLPFLQAHPVRTGQITRVKPLSSPLILIFGLPLPHNGHRKCRPCGCWRRRVVL